MTHTHTPRCRDLLGSISEYVDGSLQDDLCRELERHLSECENCRIVVDTFKKTIYLYQSSSAEADLPVGVRERLFKRLDLDEFAKKA
ncbi:MAG: zf-HC2 domain-containing protein [Chloroflexi bacterium]|nr:zf-HC2 domain-containing protein [Chloroflexota bacterium]